MSIEQALATEPLNLFDGLNSPGVIAIIAVAVTLAAGVIVRAIAQKKRSKVIGNTTIFVALGAAVVTSITFAGMHDNSKPKMKEAWPVVETHLTEKYALEGASPVTKHGKPVTTTALGDQSLAWMEDLTASLVNVGHPGPKTAVFTEEGHRHIYNVTVYNGEAVLRIEESGDTPAPKPEELLRDNQT